MSSDGTHSQITLHKRVSNGYPNFSSNSLTPSTEREVLKISPLNVMDVTKNNTLMTL